MKRTRSLITSGLIVFALAACGDVREDLGLGRAAPDEFAVVDRAPLSMPPDFTLRPPQPGAARPQEPDMTQRADTIVFGANAPADKPPSAGNSAGEKDLLAATGADKADPHIRSTVDREAAQKVVGTEHLVDELLWWRKPGPSGTVVDAAAEAARIKQAQAKGQPLNQSATPVIERQKTGWLNL